MKTGFFFEKIPDLDLVTHFALSNKLQLAGISVNEKEGLTNDLSFLKPEDELIAQIELAIIFLDGKSYFKLAAKALKKGINIFLASLPDYKLDELITLKELAFEINRRVGFGCSGFNLIDPSELYIKHFMIQMNRDTGADTNDLAFSRILVQDIASFVRLKPCGVKKLRVNGVPIFSITPKALNLRLEYDNNSVIVYSLTRLDEPAYSYLRLFSGENIIQKDLPSHQFFSNTNTLFTPHQLLTDSLFSSNFRQFIAELVSGTPINFSVDKAIETLAHLATIKERLSPVN